MTANIYTQADTNVRKTIVLMTGFLLLVIAIGYVFAEVYQNVAALFIAIVFAVVMNVVSYWYSDKIVLGMHHAVPATREVNFDLWNIAENLAITAGLPMPKLYVIEDSAPNAFATGRNKEHSVICVTTGLLSILNKTELEGVVAHEMSHIGNKDILLSTVAVVLAGFVSILSHYFMRGFAFRRRDDREGGGIFAIVGVVLAILAPLFATLMQLAISRKREFLADASGALLTRYPEGLASALQKIGQYSEPMKTATSADAHLFISNPFGKEGSIGSSIQKLFLTHPPIAERIKALVGER